MRLDLSLDDLVNVLGQVQQARAYLNPSALGGLSVDDEADFVLLGPELDHPAPFCESLRLTNG